MVEQEVRPGAFNVEYRANTSEKILFDDVVSYLGEYRFNLQKYSYNLTFKEGKLRDPHRGEPMSVLTQRAIDKKFWEGRSSTRESAEKKGFIGLDTQLNLAKNGDTIVWASPPGPKEDGYGDYGFIFVGKINEQDLGEKRISMTAIRVENPNISQFNRAWQLFTGEKTEYKTPEDFLRNPQVLKEDLKEGYMDAVLGMSFDFELKKEEKEKFSQIIQKMRPLLKDFVELVRFGSSNEKIKALNSIENYALKLKRDYENNVKDTIYVKQSNNFKIKDIVGDFGYKPPTVKGSCGSSSSNSKLTSSNFLGRESILNDLAEDQEWFTCPRCNYKADGPVGNQCPCCGLTKEEHAKESGVTCD